MKRRQSSSSSSSSSSSASPSIFWWWWWLLLRRTSSRTSFSRSSCVLVVSVCSSSPRRSLRSPARLFARMCVIVCVCVSFNFHFLLLLLLLFFFGGLTVSNAALLAHFVSSFSFLRCNSRGSLSPLFFSRIEQNTYTRAHVQTRTHRRTDGRREKSARAPLVLGSTHKTILRFLLLCVIAIIMIGCCCYSLFMGCFLALLINRDRVRYMHNTLVRGEVGELFTIFQLFRDALFGNLLLRLRRLALLP